MSLQQRIMNLQPGHSESFMSPGSAFGQARRAAAELAAPVDALVEQMAAALEAYIKCEPSASALEQAREALSKKDEVMKS